MCVCHVCMLLCFRGAMTQLYIQEIQALILAVTLIWNTISTVFLRRPITLIHLLACTTLPGCYWWAERVCFEPFCSSFITPSPPLCPFIVNRVHFYFYWTATPPSHCANSLSVSSAQGTLKISLPYSPTKTLSVKSILRWEHLCHDTLYLLLKHMHENQ